MCTYEVPLFGLDAKELFEWFNITDGSGAMPLSEFIAKLTQRLLKFEEHKEKGYWSKICDLQRQQTEKGIKTYGQTLEENKALTTEERLTYLEEELIDGLMYIEHLKAKLREMEKDIEG